MNRFIRDFYIHSYLTISEVKNLPKFDKRTKPIRNIG